MEKLLALQRWGYNFVLFWADKISNYWNQLGKQAARAVGRGKLKSRTGTWLPNFPRPCAFSWQSLPVNIWIVAALPYGRRKSANSIGSPAKPSFSFRFSLDHQDLACCSALAALLNAAKLVFSLTKNKNTITKYFWPTRPFPGFEYATHPGHVAVDFSWNFPHQTFEVSVIPVQYNVKLERAISRNYHGVPFGTPKLCWLNPLRFGNLDFLIHLNYKKSGSKLN